MHLVTFTDNRRQEHKTVLGHFHSPGTATTRPLLNHLINIYRKVLRPDWGGLWKSCKSLIHKKGCFQYLKQITEYIVSA